MKLMTGHWESRIKEFTSNMNFHLAWGEAHIQLSKADSLLYTSLNETIELNYELEEIWMACDMYKRASILSRGIVIEIEAEVLTKMGNIFYKLFKDSRRATTYLKQAFYLVESLKPKTFNGVTWFEEMRNCMMEIQKEVPEEKEEEIAEEFYQKHAVLLENLKKQKNSFEFLRHIYATFLLPTVEKRKLPELNSSNIKRHLFVACAHYHPDKFVDECFDGYSQADSKFISTEITKILTSFYSKFKGFSDI